MSYFLSGSMVQLKASGVGRKHGGQCTGIFFCCPCFLNPSKLFKSLKSRPIFSPCKLRRPALLAQATAIGTVLNKCPQSSLLRGDMVFCHNISGKGRQEITLTHSPQSIFTTPLRSRKVRLKYFCSFYLADAQTSCAYI